MLFKLFLAVFAYGGRNKAHKFLDFKKSAICCDLGAHFLRRGELHHAVKRFREALALNPDNAKAEWYLILVENRIAEEFFDTGSSAFRDGQYEQAKACFLHAMEMLPDFVLPYILLAGIAREVDEDFETSKHYLRKVLEIDAKRGTVDESDVKRMRFVSEIYVDLGITSLLSLDTEMRNDDLQTAKNCFEKATQFDKNWGKPWMWLGLICENLGQSQQAEESYTKGLQLN